MKYLLLSVITLTTSLVSCQKTADTHPKPTPDLVGSWVLTNRQCYCVPGPLPNETVTFTSNGFAFYRNGQLTNSGTYSGAVVTSFCGGSPTAGIRLTGNISQQEAGVTVTDDTLVLDYGGPCDAPVDTYQRQ